MKIVLFHISDIHLEKKNDIKVSNIHKMVDVLNGIGRFDEIIIVVSGDIAFSGTKQQYQVAYQMFGTLITEIKKRFNLQRVKMFTVPGNHDVDLTDDAGHEIIQKNVRNGITKNMIVEELNKQKNYLNYAKGIHSMDERDKLCCIRECKYDDVSLKFCLVNTAIFSTLDEDKGLHYIPQSVLHKIRSELDADINITILHHAHHWMNDSVKRQFEDILFRKNNIILCGHEHDLESSIISKDGAKVIYLTGGVLSDRGNWLNSQFYLHIIDTKKMSLDSNSYIWDSHDSIYTRKNETGYSLLDMNPKLSFELDEEFQEGLHTDGINDISNDVFDYYVFPDIETMRDYSDKEPEMVTDEVSFIENILIKRKIAVFGGESSGKTLLLKRMFLELTKREFCCIYCDADALKQTSFKKTLLTLFRYNYKDQKGDYDKFLQLPKEQRVLLIDDINDINKEQVFYLLKYLRDYFDIIIYSTKELIEFDLVERVRKSVEIEDYCRYKILPMYMKKREKLISNIVRIKGEAREENPEISKKICEVIRTQRKIYSMNPSFIIQFVDFYLKNFKDVFATDGNIFSKVFENNIVNRIRPVAKKMTVDKILVLLDEVAYWCYKEQKSEIAQENVNNIISKYNEEHDDEVEYLDFVEACTHSKILKRGKTGSFYRFADKNILSYCIAREIIRIWNDNLDDTDLKNLIKFIRYGINSNIILFVTYLTDNLYLIRNIIDCTLEYVDNWNTFDIVNVNVPYLAMLNGTIALEAPTQREREKVEEEEEEQDKKEIEEYEDTQIVVTDYFDPKTDDCETLINQIIRSMTLLDITSKCLPGFEHRMNKEDKEKVLNIIFNLPGKIFYTWASQIEAEREELLQYLLEIYRTTYLRQRDWDKINEIDMMRYLQIESLSLFLELLNIPINNATKDYTIRYLLRYSKQDEILYQLQMLMAFSKLDMVSDVEKILRRMEPNFIKCIPDYMKRRVLHRFLITSKKITQERLQKLVSTYFPSGNKTNTIYRNILIGRERNKKKQ